MNWLLGRVASVAVGVALVVLFHWKQIVLFPGNEQASILGTIAQVSASMMGFMMAALAILASVADKPLLKNMQPSGHFKDLLTTLFFASLIFALAFSLSIAVLVFGDFGSYWREALVGLLGIGTVAIAQTGWKFWLVLTNINPDE